MRAPHRSLGRMLHRALKVIARPVKSDRGRGGVVVHAFRGYGAATRVEVMGRVFRQLPLGVSAPEGSLRRDLLDVLRRGLRWGIKGIPVTLELHGQRQTVTTDRDGYFDIHMALAAPLVSERIWHRGRLDAVIRGEHSVGSQAEIYVPPPTLDLVVISDIDDTVMRTGVANKLKMMYRLFLRQAHQRTAFAGVAEFYRALFAGADGHRYRPMLYVSRGPWGLYEVLEEFFQRNRIPIGPILFLREWGLTLQRPLPRRAREHKYRLIEQMLALYARQPLVLIGDSGQHDPETYARVVREHPGRVKAIYIRHVHRASARDDEIARLAREVAEDGCHLVLTDDSAEMAAHAHDLGLVSTAGLTAVRRAVAQA
ncbi:DUF2183 domain-containing protein [Halomonas nitroreducens]|uniref:DUF2183 domain-containing protein n=2 Tax=Halomonas nitroreducens TaxID=447425 RepID=A0A431V4E8_9GAMM|nr:phosphatase domain-containing protein [Halomonas nitroreducens]RTR02933.1 DUF2183 domain-containing protein [Halomonas nitroreducens]